MGSKCLAYRGKISFLVDISKDLSSTFVDGVFFAAGGLGAKPYAMPVPGLRNAVTFVGFSKTPDIVGS